MNKADLIQMHESITQGDWHITEGDVWSRRSVCCRPDCDEHGYTCCGWPDIEEHLVAQTSEQEEKLEVLAKEIEDDSK